MSDTDTEIESQEKKLLADDEDLPRSFSWGDTDDLGELRDFEREHGGEVGDSATLFDDPHDSKISDIQLESDAKQPLADIYGAQGEPIAVQDYDESPLFDADAVTDDFDQLPAQLALSPLEANFFSGGGRGFLMEQMEHLSRYGPPLLLLVGEQGCGKSTLASVLKNRINSEFFSLVAFHADALTDENALRARLAMELELDLGIDKVSAVAALTRYVQELDAQGKTTMIIVDDAQLIAASGIEFIQTLAGLLGNSGLRFLLSVEGSSVMDVSAIKPLLSGNESNYQVFHVAPLNREAGVEFVKFYGDVKQHKNALTSEQAGQLVDVAKGNVARITTLLEQHSARDHQSATIITRTIAAAAPNTAPAVIETTGANPFAGSGSRVDGVFRLVKEKLDARLPQGWEVQANKMFLPAFFAVAALLVVALWPEGSDTATEAPVVAENEPTSTISEAGLKEKGVLAENLNVDVTESAEMRAEAGSAAVVDTSKAIDDGVVSIGDATDSDTPAIEVVTEQSAADDETDFNFTLQAPGTVRTRSSESNAANTSNSSTETLTVDVAADRFSNQLAGQSGSAASSSAAATTTTGLTKTTVPTKTANIEDTSSPQPKTTVATAQQKIPTNTTSGAASADQAQSKRQLLALPKNHFMLQLLGARERSGVQKLLNSHQDVAHLYYYETSLSGKPWYVVVQGNYTTRDAAKQGLKQLPVNLRSAKPWVRDVKSIHALLD